MSAYFVLVTILSTFHELNSQLTNEEAEHIRQTQKTNTCAKGQWQYGGMEKVMATHSSIRA